MTVIGKMLVFLVLVLTLVWNALTVNAYVTRTNWKAVADKHRDEALNASGAATQLRRLIDAEREASDDRVRVLREERDRLYEQVNTARRGYDEVNKAYQDRQKADRELGVQASQLQANVATLQKQVEDLTQLQGQKDKQIDEATLKAERATADMVRATIEAEAQKRRAELLNERIIAMRDEQSRGPVGGGLTQRSIAPQGFRGTVRAFQGGQVALTPGLDAGLQVGAVLDVFRTTGGNGEWLGRVRITHVDPKEAVGEFQPKAGLSRASYPRAGDELKPD